MRRDAVCSRLRPRGQIEYTSTYTLLLSSRHRMVKGSHDCLHETNVVYVSQRCGTKNQLCPSVTNTFLKFLRVCIYILIWDHVTGRWGKSSSSHRRRNHECLHQAGSSDIVNRDANCSALFEAPVLRIAMWGLRWSSRHRTDHGRGDFSVHLLIGVRQNLSMLPFQNTFRIYV